VPPGPIPVIRGAWGRGGSGDGGTYSTELQHCNYPGVMGQLVRHPKGALPVAGLNLGLFPRTLQARCGGRNRRDPTRACGYRFGAWPVEAEFCACCQTSFVVCPVGPFVDGMMVKHDPFKSAPWFRRNTSIDRIGSSAQTLQTSERGTPRQITGDDYGGAIEFTCPQCSARPRVNRFTLGRLWVQAARRSERQFYMR